VYIFYTRLSRFCYSIREACECRNNVSVYAILTLPLYTHTHTHTHYMYKNILCSCIHLGGYIIYFLCSARGRGYGEGRGDVESEAKKLQHYMLLSNKTKIHINKIKRFFRDLRFIYKVVLQYALKSR